MKLFIILCSIILILIQSFEDINIDSLNNFIDNYGRIRIFHGVNAVYKISPWIPITEGFDKDNSLSDIDASIIKSWGMNIIRLGIMWPGVEPVKGYYNTTYLDEIEKIVDIMAKKDIYVLVDFHQDLWHRKFCGEGVPDYVYGNIYLIYQYLMYLYVISTIFIYSRYL